MHSFLLGMSDYPLNVRFPAIGEYGEGSVPQACYDALCQATADPPTAVMLGQLVRQANKKGASVQGLIGYPVAMGLVFTGGFFTLSGTVGFVLNSMDLHKDAHTVYAGMAFAAILVYLLGFLVLAFDLKCAHNDRAAMVAWLVAAGTLVALGTSGYYWLEFVHIAASTVCAFMLVPPETHAVLATTV
jgi:hypothetical protein